MRTIIRHSILLPILVLSSAIAAWGQAVVITNGTNLGVWTIGVVQTPLTATGGNGTYAWDITSGSLPTGLTIRTDVPSWFGSAQAGIIGVATTQGTYNFTLRVTSGASSTTLPVTMRITSLVAQDEFQLPDGFSNVAYAYTFTPVGNTGAVVFNTSISVSTPGGVANPFTLTAGGLLSGTPITPGTYSVNLNFTDQTTLDTCYRGYNIYVSALQITSPGKLPNAPQNTAYSQTVTASGGDGNYTFTVSGLPNGLSINSATGVISGTVNTGPNRFGFNLTVSDPGFGSYTKLMSIDVPTPNLPSQSAGVYNDCTVGSNCGQVITNSSGTAPFVWTASGLPAGMAIRPYDAANGPRSNSVTPGDVEWYGVPLSAGDYNITLTVTDANSHSASQIYPLHVSNLSLDCCMINGTQGTPYSYTFRVLGGSGPYAAQYVDVQNSYFKMPDGLSLSGLTLSGTPLESGGFGPRFHFTDASSGSLTVSSGVFINSTAATTINNFTFNPFYLLVNHSFSLQICCSGFTFSETGTLPPGLTFTADGLLSGTPTVVGTYPILVTSSNASGAGTREIILIVQSLALVTNTNPLPYGTVGSSYAQAISVSGAVGGLTWTLLPGNYYPPGLSMVGNNLTGTPTQSGQYSFSLYLTDAGGNAANIFFTVDIYPIGGPPPLFINQNPNLGSWFIGDDQMQLFAGGGTGSYTWTNPGGGLPPGCALRTDVPTFFPASASAGILCVATTPGTYNFTLSVSSGAQSVSQPYSVHINNLMTMETGFPNAFVNRPYTSYTVTSMHADGTAVGSVTYGVGNNVPPGMSFVNGTLLGTPTASGFYNINFTLTEGAETITRFIGVNVFVVRVDSPSVLPNATQFSPYTTTFAASGGSGSFTFAVNSLPSGLSLDTNTGIVTGTPTSGPGRFQFNLTATDTASGHPSYVKTMEIDVIGLPVALPWIPALGLGECSVGVNCSRQVSVVSGGTAPFTWSATGLPPGMGFRQGSGGDNGSMASYIPATDSEIWGIPTQAGSYTIVATVTDANGATTTENLYLNVSNLFIDTGLVNGTYDVAYTSTARVLGGSGSYTTQILPGTGSYPSGTSLSGLTLSGTPVENGSFSEELQISDTTTPTHNVLNTYLGLFVSGAPGTTLQVNTTGLSFVLGSSVNFTLSACCVPSYTWSFVSGSFPPGSPAFSLSPAGVLTGTPTAAGVYSFVAQAADQINAANFARRLITVTITPMSITTPSPLAFGNATVAYNQPLAATGGIGTLIWSLTPTSSALPQGLTLDPSTGLISGTPSFSGQYNFTVMVVDSAGNSTTRGYTINVYPFGANPPLNLTTGPNLGNYTLGTVQQFQLNTSGGVPPYSYSLTPGFTDIPGMRVLNGLPLPTFFTPGVTGGYAGLLNTVGAFSTSIRVVDHVGAIFDKAVSITVVPFAILASNPLPRATVGQSYSFQFQGFGGSGNYSWAIPNPPAGLSGLAFSGVTPGQLTGTPTVAGSFNFTVNITDLSTNFTDGFGYTLNVNPFAITNSSVLPQAAVGVPYLQTLTAPSCGSGCVWTASSPGAGLSLRASNSAVAVSSCTESVGVTCIFSGTPTGTLNSTITVTATGAAGTATNLLALQVLNPPQPLSMSTTSFGNSTLGNNASSVLSAQGGSPPYAWDVTAGSLPPGISLNGPGETLGQNLTPGFTYLWGRLQAAGSFTFTLRVTDANSNSVSRTFTWYIQRTTLSYTGLPVSGVPLVLNTPYSQSLLGLGGTGVYTFTTTSATAPMPPGLTLSLAGVVSGTPLNSGSYSVPIQMTDSAGNILLSTLSLTIGSGTASTLTFSGPFLGTVQMGGTTLFSLSPSGGTAPYTFSVPTTAPATPSNTMPPGCALEQGPSALNNPTFYLFACRALTPGTYSVMLEVQDSVGNVGYRTVTVTFAPFEVLSSLLQSGTVGVPYSSPLPAWDNFGTVVWSLINGTVMPPGLGISGSSIVGTPTTAGNYSFTLSATDASGAVVNFGFTMAVSTMNITDAQALPLATVGVPYGFTFHATGGAGALTWSVTGLGAPLTLSPTTGVLSGTPTGVNSSARLLVTVTDGVTTFSKAFTLWIRNQYPQELNFSLTGANLTDAVVGQNYSSALLPTGGLPPAFWTLVPGFSLPPGLGLYTGASLSPSLIPNATYLAGAPSTAGFYTFDMIMTDTAGNQTRRTFTLNVSPMGILSTSLLTATEGVAYNQQYTAVGGTPPYTFTYRASRVNTPMFPPGVIGSPAGVISGTPTSAGLYAFFVTAADSIGHTFTTSSTLNVTGPTGTSFNPVQLSSLTTGVGFGISTSISSGATYTYSLLSGSLPAGLTLNPTGVPLLISGAPTTPGGYAFTVRATDTSNPANFADSTFSGSVAPMMPIIPKGSEVPAARVGSAYSYSFRIVGGTPPYTFQEGPLFPIPPGLILGLNGTLAGTPQDAGTFSLFATVTDALSNTLTTSLGTMTIITPGQPNPLIPLGGTHFSSLGSPDALELDQSIQGGAPPYTWTVGAGSSLPPGMSIAPSGNGVSAYVVGIPTTAGTYPITFTVTDAALQNAPVNLTIIVQPIAVSPAVLPNGVVGSAYSATLLPSGGTPPYTISLVPTSDLPVGLTLSPAGVLSGTPQFPGLFRISVNITDSAATPNVYTKLYTVGIDTAGGQAAAIGINPSAMQMSYVRTGPGPSPIPVSITGTSAGLGYTAMVSGIPGASLSATSGTAPDSLNLSLNTAGLSTGVYAGVAAVNSATSTNTYQGVPFVLTVTDPPPCTYSLSSNAGSVSSGVGTGSFSMSTGSLCSWTATVPNAADNWISIASGGGTGSGNVSFNVTANAGTTSRAGTILAGGQNYQVTQFGSACSLAISPSVINVTAAGGVATINVNSNGACPWTASGLGATPPSGTGTGQVQVAIPSTSSGSPPPLFATIAGQTLTVNQSGVACVAVLDAGSATYGPGLGSGSVNVTIPSGCSYSTVGGPTWINITSNGSGSGPGPVNLAYTVAANSTTVSRSGVLTIGGQPYQVTQNGIACSVTVDASASGSPFGSTGGSGTITLTANGSNCSWSASSAAPWASMTPSSGMGSASLMVNVTSNSGSPSSRNTNFTIAGTTVGITESGINCTYALGSTNGSAPASGGSGSVGVIAPAVCPWSASSTPGDWVTVTPVNPLNSSGSGDVQFTASPNPTAVARSTSFTAAGITYALSQAGAPCTYALSSTSTTVAASGAGSSYTFTAASGCSATAVSYSSWITVGTVSAPDGSSGTVNYTVSANAAGGSRTGSIQLAGQSFTITQTGATCAYSLSSYGQSFSTAGGTSSFLGSPSAVGCTPSVGTTQPTIVSIGTLTGPVLNIFTLPFTVFPFTGELTPVIRYATITFGGQLFTVKQRSW